uniref:Tdrd7_2 protein n=2 Tax=Fopius arisanus TaxID=64838 RepID=A0A0C9R1B2_9HYME
MDELVVRLRACLTATKGGVPLEHLNSDFRSLEGENIPYRQLGFANLEDFLAQVPGLRRYQKGGVVYIEVIPGENTAHLVALINKQKTSKKPRRMQMTSRRPIINDNARSRYNNHQVLPPQSPRRSFQPQKSGNPPRFNPQVIKNQNQEPLKSWPPRAANPAAQRIQSRPVNQERPVIVYPAKPVNPERTVTVYPAKPVAKPEPLNVHPPRAVVKSDGNSMIYSSAASPRGEPIPVVTRQQNRLEDRSQIQNPQANGDVSRPHPQVFSNHLNQNNYGRTFVSPPQTPKSSQQILFNGDFGLNGFRGVSAVLGGVTHAPVGDNSPGSNQNVNNGVSMPSLVPFETASNQKIPPPLKVVRPLSERLRRPSPEPQPSDKIFQGIKTEAVTVKSEYSSPITPPPEAGDPREELRALTLRLNLSEPAYKTVNVGKGGRVNIFTQVMVGKHKYSSYPFDAASEVEAAKLAAVAAVNALHRLHESPAKMRITEDKEVVIQRIIKIVDGHPNGVFRDRLPGLYEKEFHEMLPDDWVDYIEGFTGLALEKGVDNSIIVCRSEPQVHVMKSPPLSPKREKCLYKQPLETLRPLVLPSSKLWPVYVSHVSSTSDVWIRLLEDEYNEKFYAMSQELSVHYASVTEPAASVEILNHYVTKIKDEAHRVRVEALDPLTGDATIFFVDTGDNDIVNTSMLFPLDKKFLEVPPQTVRACLSTLEDIAVCDTTTDIAESHLLDKTFYMQVLRLDEDEISHVVVGVFYDTTSEMDVNVNEKISLELHEAMEMSKPEAQVGVKGKLLEVFVSHIEMNGDVYLRVKNDGMAILTSMLNCLMEGIAEDEGILAKAAVDGKIDPDQIYLAQKPNGEWVRVGVSYRGNEAVMRTVDSGDIVEVELKKLLRLQELSDNLARFPAQVIKVEMNNLGRNRFTERMASRLRELAGPTDILLCKVVQPPVSNRVAIVELFKRSQPDNLLISINDTLDLEPKIVKCGDGNNNVRKKRLERRGSRSSDESLKALKSPTIPGIGEFFNVSVTNLTSSPDNFIVQPFEEKPKLEGMMKALQEAYKTNDGTKMMMNDLEKGKVCAVKYYDGFWYRACINRVLDDQSVSVHLCDFGNINIVTLSQVQPLRREFYDLPYQAIKARLVGIQPLNADWPLTTCLRFQKLVVNRNFVSVIRRLEHDDSTPSNIVLGLELIDVSLEDRDIYIHKVLIEERRALPEAS